MRDFLAVAWKVSDSWATNPQHAGLVKRYVAIVLEDSPADTVLVLGGFHPEAIEHQRRAMSVAKHVVDLHNATIS